MEKIQILAQLGVSKQKKKHEHLFQQGDKSDVFYLIKSGLLKAYYVTPDGREYVKSFITAGGFIGSLTACYEETLCSFNLSCLEDTDYIEVKYETLYALTGKEPEMATFMLNNLLMLAMKKERREYEFLCLSAPERYQLLCERQPELLDRVTQNDIARYLGITPVALSRIKNRQEKSV